MSRAQFCCLQFHPLVVSISGDSVAGRTRVWHLLSNDEHFMDGNDWQLAFQDGEGVWFREGVEPTPVADMPFSLVAFDSCQHQVFQAKCDGDGNLSEVRWMRHLVASRKVG